MDSWATRKQRERFFLERFLSASGMDGRIVAADEAPDFALSVEGRIVGVEVTELFAGETPGRQPLRAHEALSARIVVAARKAYEQCGGSPLHVSIGFFSGVDLRTIHRETLAVEIARLLLQMRISQGQYEYWRNDYTNPVLAPVAFMNVLGLSAPEFAHWFPASGGFSVPLTLRDLQSCVTYKNNRVQVYRQRYKEVWLIVATEGTRPSQFFDVTSFNEASAVESDFDRTYFLVSFTGQVVRLGGESTV